MAKEKSINIPPQYGAGDARILVYDSFGRFLGHKADTVWTLSEHHFKPHTLEYTLPNKPLVKNLIFGLNESGHMYTGANLDDKGTLYLVVEGIYDNNELFGYSIKKNSKGKYFCPRTRKK